jgi:hypothetical protein
VQYSIIKYGVQVIDLFHLTTTMKAETDPDQAPEACVHIPTPPMSNTNSDIRDQLHSTKLASQDSQSGTTDTFTLFPKLPIELRLKIWKETLPEARVIEAANYRQQGQPKITILRLTGPLSTILKTDFATRDLDDDVEVCPDPVALKVCHEPLEVLEGIQSYGAFGGMKLSPVITQFLNV